MEYTTIKIRENMWAIEQQGVRSFLLTGPESAILIDTCFGGDILSACAAITDKPITLLTTHSDPDHTGCDHQFPLRYLHPAEFDRYERRNGKPANARPMWEGDTFTVGEHTLEVVLIPGHTPGSVALLDRKHRFLLSGDTVQAHIIYMHGDGRNLPAFLHSIRKLEQMRMNGDFDIVYPSHGDLALPADILQDHQTLAEELIGGTAAPIGPAPERFPDTVKTYGHGRVRMYY